MKRIFIIIFIICTILSGCTTATYGNKFEPFPGQEDVYSFKVYTGGFAGKETARKRFEVEVSDFMLKAGYKSYKLLEEKYVIFPSGVE
jgi:hypothetical protein